MVYNRSITEKFESGTGRYCNKYVPKERALQKSIMSENFELDSPGWEEEDMFGNDDDMDLVAAAEDGVEVERADATPPETLPG